MRRQFVQRVASVAILALNIPSTMSQTVPQGTGKPAAPSFDFGRNPGCGVEYQTAKERTERNARIVEYYYQAEVQVKQGKNLQHDLPEYGCFADPLELLVGYFNPEKLEPVMMPMGPSGEAFRKVLREGRAPGQIENANWLAVYPDWGGTPGTLRVIPWENGVHYVFQYDGTSKKSGRHLSIWESGVMLINAQGKVTQWELWGDTLGLDEALREMFGKSLREVNMATYGELLNSHFKAQR